MTPGESDLALLETARRCDFYGIKFHLAKVSETKINTQSQHFFK
jgi:hypothetical protein